MVQEITSDRKDLKSDLSLLTFEEFMYLSLIIKFYSLEKSALIFMSMTSKVKIKEFRVT